MKFEPKYKMSREDTIFAVERGIVDLLWKSANIEVAVSFPDTNELFEGRTVHDVSLNDSIVINNLKRSWFYIIETLDEPITLAYITKINMIIGEATKYSERYGKIRTNDVFMSGTYWRPEVPVDSEVREEINDLLNMDITETERALEMFAYIMRKQIFGDGNKRTALMIANKIIITSGEGMIATPVKLKNEFIKNLINYYETGDNSKLKEFLYENSIMGIHFND